SRPPSSATAPPLPYSPSLHDALPIYLWVVDDAGAAWLRAGMSGSGWLARLERNNNVLVERGGRLLRFRAVPVREPKVRDRIHTRSEEHTSELQSPDHLVCRLLLEKKK